MALDYAMNADFRRIPDPDDPDDVATISRALTIYDEAIMASESVDGDTGLPVDTARVQGATLIRCAEAAVDYHEDARGALAAYFREDPPRDQYYVRALFIQALLRSREALKYNGLIRLTITKEAIQFLLQAITIAEEFAVMISSNPASNDTSAYGFLIYNASVHHYSIIRSLLLRDGARIHAIPSLTRFIEALQKSDDPDIRWRARYILTLATCHAEIGELDKAITLTTQAIDLYGKLTTPVIAGTPDYQMIEDAIRLRSHFTSLTDISAAAEGTGKAVAITPVVFPGAAKTDDNLRVKILQQLQPMLTGSAVAMGSTGYSYNIGRGPHGFQTNFQTTTGTATNPSATPLTPPNKETIRSKLVDMMKLLRSSTAAEYVFRKAEADLGTLKMATPDFKQNDSVPVQSTRASQTGVAASTTNASSSSSADVNNKGKDLDLMALLAQVAVHHQLWDVAHTAVRAIHTDKTTSPAGQILADIVDAQLLVGCLSLQDAHQSLGHYVEIPQDVIATLAIQEQGQTEQTASNDINRPKIRTRRQSVATAMSVAFVPRRSSTGKALMQPSNFPYGKPIPQPTISIINTLIESRRLIAMKPLRRALIMARNYGNPYLSELAATVTWNIALPLLRTHTRTIIYPTLIAAADALSTIDSPLVQLRVRLHLEIARAYYALDILPASSEHLNHALALDYGGLRADPHNGNRIAHVPIPSHAERKALLARKGGKDDELTVANTKTTRELSTQRPLDRQLLPLAHTVALTGAVYNDPSDAMDQAALTLGQAKVATDPTVISTLLNKAALQIEIALELPKEATTAWKKLRSPSFAVTASVTAAVLVLPNDQSAPVTAENTSATHPPPSTATTSSRPSTTVPTNKLVPPPTLPAYPNGETTDSIQSTRRKQGHRLCVMLAELATQTKQWDLVLRAVHEIRSYGWDPINARDMVLLQAKADLLLSEAAVAKTIEYTEIMMEEKCREAALQASRQQEKRIQVAMERLKAGTPIPANMINPVPVYPPSLMSPNATEESKKGMEDKPLRLRNWWDDDEDFGMDTSNDTLKDDPYKDIEVPDVADDGILYLPLAPLNESVSLVDMEPERHPPRQYIPSEAGRRPGHKQIPSDAHALGLIVPGCPLSLVAWKLRIISALVRCMRRGVALGTPWIVETAAIRLWNLHMHIWQTNDYGSAILPPLIESLTDTVTCLLSINTVQTALLSKIVFVIARYYEEEAKSALVNEALGIPANTNAYIGINGAVLVDYASLLPSTGILEGNLSVASPVTPEDRRIIYQRLVQLLIPSTSLIQSAEMTLNIVFQYISTTNMIPVARKDCVALRARLRLFTLAGHGIGYLLNEPNGQPHVSPNRASLLETLTKGCTGDATDTNTVSTALVPVPSSFPLPPPSTGMWSCPDYGLAIGLLQIMNHDDISFNDKVSALRLTIDTLPKCTEQLNNFILDVCGPDPEAGLLAAHAHANAQAQVDSTKGGGGRPPTQAAPKPGTAAATTKGGTAPTSTPVTATSPSLTDDFPTVHNLTKEAKASFQTATFSNPTVAANEAKRAELQKLHTTAMAELWARTAQAAVVLAKASMYESKNKPANGTVPPTTTTPSSTPSSSSLTTAPVKPTAGDPDLSLLTDAQRCAAEAITLVPMSSALRIDELGSLFGLKGYDYDAYRLEVGPVYAKITNPVAETVDVAIGRVGFRHRFGIGLDGGTIDGLGKGGYGNAFKWWSIAELAWGQAVGMLVNPERQNVIEQDALRRAALDHLSLASEWATRIRDNVLITATAFAIWNLAIPLALSKVTRPPLTQPLRRLLTAMNTSSTKKESHDAYLLRTELYVLLSQCHADATNWTNGLQVVEEAFATLPSIYHDRLWNHRLMFQSKLGQDVTQALMALKSKNPLLQARLWTSLARLAALPSDQSAAYVSALDTLQGMFTRAYVLLDYAEWLFSNHLPINDVRDALHSAADTFLEIIAPSANDNSNGGGGEGTIGGEGSTVGYGTQGSVIRGGGSSVMGRQSSFMPSRRSVTGGGGSVAQTMAMRSSIAYSKPLPTMAGSQVTGTSGSLAGNSKLQSNDEPSDWPTKPEVCHYDALVRIFTHLALIAENGHERLNYLLLVVHYIKEAWLLTVHTLNRIHAEKMFFKMRESERAKITNYDQWLEDTTKNGTYKVPEDLAQWTVWWSQVTKYLPQAEERCKPVIVPVAVTKGKSRPSSQAKPPTPSTAPTTATPAPTDEQTNALSSIPAEELQPALDYVTMRQSIATLTAQNGVYVISRGSIRRPALTMYVLHWILDQLFAAGYHHYAAPVLAFMHTLSADLIDPPRSRDPFTSVTLARTGVWADQINARETSLAIFNDLSTKGKLTLNDTVRRIHEGEVVLLDVGKNKSSGNDNGSIGLSAQAAMVSALATKKLKAALKGGNMIGGLRNIARRIITNGEVRWAWVTLAQIAATRGMVRGARQLLLETWRHADAFVDWPLQWQAKIMEAQLAAMEGDGKVAVDLIIEAVKDEGDIAGTSMEIPAWEDVILLLGNILINNHLYNDAKVALRASLDVFDQVTNPLIIEVPDLSTKQLDALNQGGGITKQISANKQNSTTGAPNNNATANTSSIFASIDKPTPKPSKEINIDAAITGVKIRLLLAHVYTLEAIRTRKVGGSWLNDWRIGDALYAEAAEICRRYRLDTYGGLLSIALSSHAKAILACPGADLDGIPPISHDRQFTDVAESSDDMRNRFRATTPPRRARLLYLALACKLLHEASASCSSWYSSLSLTGTGPSLSSPAHHLSCQIAADLAYADTLYTEEEISAALASERLIYAEVAANPVALYLHQAEQASTGITSGVVQVIQTTPSRAAFILDAATRALSTVSVHLPQEYGQALIAYGIGLYASMLSHAATIPFSTAPKESSESLLASCGIVELDRQLWDIVQPKKDTASVSAVESTTVPELTTVSRPPSATSKAPPPSKIAPAKTAPTPVPAPVSNRTEFVPFPSQANDDSTASVRMITNMDPEITLPTIVPSVIRQLHNQTIQTLTQGLSFAASTKNWTGVGNAAAYLVDCYGTLAPVRAALSLAMYQSCITRNDLYSVFKTAAGLTSKQVLHIDLVERMKNEYTHPEDLPIYTSAIQYLNDNSIVYRMMDCGRSIEDIFKLLPLGTRVVTIQRSTSGRVLYVSVLMKTKHTNTNDEVSGLTGTISRYNLSEHEREELSNLCSDAKNIRTDYAGHVRAYSEGKGLMGEFIHAPSSLTESKTSHSMDESGGKEDHKDEMTHSASFSIKEDACENRINEVIERMNKLLNPILGSTSSIGTWLNDNCNGSQNNRNDPVILCVEKALTTLPFEALDCLASLSTVTRDFSLQVLGHRLAISNYLRTQGSNTVTAPLSLSSSTSALPCHARNSSVTYVVDPRHEDTIDGRHGSPLGRLTVLDAFTALTGTQVHDSSSTASVTGHPAPPGTAGTAVTHKAHPPVHSTDEDTSTESNTVAHSSTSPSFYDVLHSSTPLVFTDEQGKLFGSNWHGFRGDSHVPAPAAWQELLRTTTLRPVTRTPDSPTSTEPPTSTPESTVTYAGGATVFYGHGRLFAYLPPEAVAGLLCPGVRIAFLADTLTTNESARRQAILDNAKTAVEGRLELENTWDTLALLTLSGIGTLIGQQWSLSHIAMETLIHGTFTQTVRQSIPIATAVRSVFRTTTPVDKKKNDNDEHNANNNTTIVEVKNRVKYATVVYGLPHTCIIGQE